jgi:hypothetical protein
MNTEQRILTTLLLAPMSAPRLALVLSTSCSFTGRLTRLMLEEGSIYQKGMERVRPRARSARSFALTSKGLLVAQQLLK